MPNSQKKPLDKKVNFTASHDSDSDNPPDISSQHPCTTYVEHLTELNSRKKKRTSAIRDVRKDRYGYNDYVSRKSLLDQMYGDSEISQSPFKGILRLGLFVVFAFTLNNALVCVICLIINDS